MKIQEIVENASVGATASGAISAVVSPLRVQKRTRYNPIIDKYITKTKPKRK